MLYPVAAYNVRQLFTKMEREIRPYQLGDYDRLKAWLSELGRFYDGHESGRFVDQLVNKEHEDELGYFTTAKEVYIAAEGGRELGSIVLNYKRGASVKIGPFVVDPEARGRGIGTQLLSFAEQRAREKRRRKIYATTSHLNEPINRVFSKCGFQVEAQFPDQYRRGSIELIWGKLLSERGTEHGVAEASTIVDNDPANLEIERYSPRYYSRLRELMLTKLPGWHDEIDDEFVLRTIIGHLQGVDFEKKGKVILLATGGEKVYGCSVIVPKRGGPAKLYPVSGSENAQRMLIEESKEVARQIGSHKVYTFSPESDLQQQEIFGSLDFTQRGVIIEPYKAGYNLVCFDSFV